MYKQTTYEIIQSGNFESKYSTSIKFNVNCTRFNFVGNPLLTPFLSSEEGGWQSEHVNSYIPKQTPEEGQVGICNHQADCPLYDDGDYRDLQ